MVDFRTLPELFVRATEEYTHRRHLNVFEGDRWLHWNTNEFRSSVQELCLGLNDLGIRQGEPIGLIAPPGPEWLIVDLAVQCAGGITVPIFKRISPESFTHEIQDSGMRYLFVGNPDEIPMAVKHGIGLVEIFTFGCCTDNERYTELRTRGRQLRNSKPDLFQKLVSRVHSNDLATIIYTSGSTGLPKGVELTQNNLVSQMYAASQRFSFDSTRDVILSALPLAHIFERMVVYFYIATGLPIYFADDPRNLGALVKEVKPTAMTAVPRLLEKVYLKMKDKVYDMSGVKGLLARSAFRRAEHRPVAGPGEKQQRSLFDPIYDRLVYPTLREGLGGRLHTVISGSAKLDPDIARFFINIGIPVYEGYGMTESSPVIAVNYKGATKPGTVGPLFPGVEVKIGSDGEIMARGPNVMRGYHNRPDATEETLVDGWLHTGDLGSLDENGYLTITGRKKEIMKKSTGEYVPPAPIEHDLTEHPLVDTAVIFADNRVYVTALLFPDMEKVAAWKKDNGFEPMSDAEFLRSPFVRDSIDEHIREVNKHHHHCEEVVKFAILDHAPTVEAGELTPTMKVRRHEIEKQYHDVIEALYQDIGGLK